MFERWSGVASCVLAGFGGALLALSLLLVPPPSAFADDPEPEPPGGGTIALVCNAGCNLGNCRAFNGSCLGNDVTDCQRGTGNCKDCRCVGTQFTPPPIEEITACDCRPRN
jgi:hypothetical protein